MTRATPDTLRAGQPFERFKAWESAHDLALRIYRVTATWPFAERYGLTAQARRAAFSAAARICEGSARRGAKEFRRFLELSIASLSELAYVIRLAGDLAYLTPEDRTELAILRDHTHRLVQGLHRALARAGPGRTLRPTSPPASQRESRSASGARPHDER